MNMLTSLWRAVLAQAIVASLIVTAETFLYSVIIDAGSSGSRVHVYRWAKRTSSKVLPHFERILSVKSSNGDQRLADFAYMLDDVRQHVGPLVTRAATVIPKQAHDATSIFVLATAGMRMLESDRAEAVLGRVNSLLSDPGFSPFRYHSRNTRILSGEEEGAFAWLAVNYLNRYFDNPDSKQSTGIVEMGGASTQIAFLPTGSILSDKFDMRIAARHYSLYVHSYLDYGGTAANIWVDTHLATVEQPGRDPVVQPCLPKGFTFVCDKSKCGPPNVTLTGGSDPAGCTALINELIYKAEHRRCSPRPCAIGPVYQPPIDARMKFVAMSSFYRTFDRLSILQPNGSFLLSSAYAPAYDMCAKDAEQVARDYSDVPEKHRPFMCFFSIFSPILLNKGLGFRNDSRQLFTIQKIDDIELDWSLGAIIYESEREEWECRYASAASASSSSSSSLHSTSSTSPLLLPAALMARVTTGVTGGTVSVNLLVRTMFALVPLLFARFLVDNVQPLTEVRA